MNPIKTLFVVLLFTSSCASNDSSESISCGTVEISFAADVMPIVTASCATDSDCHAAGSKEGPGALTTYSQVHAARTDIASTVSSGSMPKDASLTATERNNIVCWIRNGALDN